MHYLFTVLIITLLLHFNVCSQDSVNTPSKEYEKTEITDTSHHEEIQSENLLDKKMLSTETSDTSPGLKNDTGSLNEAPRLNPFLPEDGLSSVPKPQDISKTSKIDIIMDLSIGLNATLFKATPEIKSEPAAFLTETKPDFMFEAGVIIPFLRRLYLGIYLRYFGLKYTLSDSISGVNGSYSTIDTEENLHFLSAPIKLGVTVEFNIFTPYLYAEFQPAYLTSAARHTSTKNYSVFVPDSAILFTNPVEDKDITKKRERHQIFAGGGIGLDIAYGYGSVYIEAGAMFALKEPGILSASPVLKSSNIIYFPFFLGLKFYL